MSRLAPSRLLPPLAGLLVALALALPPIVNAALAQSAPAAAQVIAQAVPAVASAPAAAPAGHQQFRAMLDHLAHRRAGLGIHHHRAAGHLENKVFSVAAMHLLSQAAAAVSGCLVGCEMEFDKGVLVPVALEDYTAAIASISAVGSAVRNEFFTA